MSFTITAISHKDKKEYHRCQYTQIASDKEVNIYFQLKFLHVRSNTTSPLLVPFIISCKIYFSVSSVLSRSMCPA